MQTTTNGVAFPWKRLETTQCIESRVLSSIRDAKSARAKRPSKRFDKYMKPQSQLAIAVDLKASFEC